MNRCTRSIFYNFRDGTSTNKSMNLYSSYSGFKSAPKHTFWTLRYVYLWKISEIYHIYAMLLVSLIVMNIFKIRIRTMTLQYSNDLLQNGHQSKTTKKIYSLYVNPWALQQDYDQIKHNDWENLINLDIQ